jgi:phage host-nuclease inhibitor protein Gam
MLDWILNNIEMILGFLGVALVTANSFMVKAKEFKVGRNYDKLTEVTTKILNGDIKDISVMVKDLKEVVESVKLEFDKVVETTKKEINKMLEEFAETELEKDARQNTSFNEMVVGIEARFNEKVEDLKTDVKKLGGGENDNVSSV